MRSLTYAALQCMLRAVATASKPTTQVIALFSVHSRCTACSYCLYSVVNCSRGVKGWNAHVDGSLATLSRLGR